MLQSLLSPPASISHLSYLPLYLSPTKLSFLKPTSNLSFSTFPRPPWPKPVSSTGSEQDGPVELPSSEPSIFATADDPSYLQVATSVLLTGAISVFLYRSLRRRAKRLRETKFRSIGAKRSLQEEALDTLKAMTPTSPGAKGPPSPIQTLLGGISAGVIALILYKFATTVEGSLNRQTLSDNFSVRQITVTIRTIINGLCYLATFVFGLNSVGLFLYSGQLVFSSIMEDFSSEEVSESSSTDSNLTAKSTEDDTSREGIASEDQSSDSK